MSERLRTAGSPQHCLTGKRVVLSCRWWWRSLRCLPVCSSAVWTRLWAPASSPAGTSRSSLTPAGWRTCLTLSWTACRSSTSPSRISLTAPETLLWPSGWTDQPEPNREDSGPLHCWQEPIPRSDHGLPDEVNHHPHLSGSLLFVSLTFYCTAPLYTTIF